MFNQSAVTLLLSIVLICGGTSDAQNDRPSPGDYEPDIGGWSNAQVTDPEIVNASRIAVLLYGQSINSGVALRMLEVLQAREQVVSGMNYNLTVSFGYTNCRQSDEDINTECCRIVYVPYEVDKTFNAKRLFEQHVKYHGRIIPG